jgi:hypothetical protein
MKNYFSPDISMLREIPKAESERLLSVETSEVQATVPDMLQVDRLLNMIQLARHNGTARRQVLA